jgi:hypothetical protein
MVRLLLATRNEQQLPRLDVVVCAYVDLATVVRWRIDNATHYGHASFFSNQRRKLLLEDFIQLIYLI